MQPAPAPKGGTGAGGFLLDADRREAPPGRFRPIAVWLPIAAVLLLLFVIAAPFRWHPHPTARTTPNGGVILAWKRAPDARHYVVRFLDPTGRTIDSIEGIETVELVLTREALPRHLTPGTQVRWTVSAVRESHLIGKSEPKPLQLP